ncbi:beta strand repeat-containing protein [Hahella sp. NBU794]|uniref:beta strand repeat-containing protein n=1 Tax=Hahella sp. NBU794 TaxID=3422590 RepID=UPI003D6E7716
MSKFDRFKNNLTPLMLAIALTACGGGGGGGDDDSGGSTSVTLSGAASKGIIIGGLVRAYPVINGAVDTSNVLGQTTTGSDGTYNLTLSSGYSGPVVVRITPTTGTLMRCDLSGGCGSGVAFGQDYALTDSGFALNAVVPTGSSNISVNITVLTDVATQVALKDITMGGATSASDIQAAVTAANSKVANRFGVAGDLTKIAIVDITNPTAVAAAGQGGVKYNTLSAAIVQAVQGDSPGLSIEQAVAAFAEDFADGGIADKADTDGTKTTLQEILASTLDILNAAVAADESGDLDLGGLITIITAEESDVQNNGSTDESEGEASDTANATELAQAKAMVQEIRNLGTGMLLSTADRVSIEAFADQIAAATFATDDNLSEVLDVMAIALEQIAASYMAFAEDGSTDGSPIVTVNIVSGGASFTVNTTIEGVAVSLTATDLSTINVGDEVETPISGGTNTTQAISAQVNFSILGAVESSLVSLSVNSGSSVMVTLSYTSDEDDTASGGTSTTVQDEDLDLSNLSLGLNVTLAEKGVGNPVSFTGAMSATLSAFSADIDETDTQTSSTYEESWMESYTAGTFAMTLSGQFSNATDSFFASLALNANATGVTLSCEGSMSGGTSSETCTDENGSTYVDADATLIFKVTVNGVADAISVKLIVDRTGLESGQATLELKYGGVTLNAAVDSVAQTLTVTNQDGVTLSVAEGSDDKVTGTITNNGTQYATISEVSGVVLVRFSDGDFESF